MPYTELLRRSLQIAWRNRWLWLLALFAGETGGGGFGNSFGGNGFSGGGRTSPGGTPSSAPPDFTPVVHWIQDHAALLVAAGVLLVLLYVALFVLSCACVAAEVRGVQEIDNGRPAGLGRAWSLGLPSFWPVLRLRLLLVVFALLVLLLIALLVVAGIVLAVAQSWAGLVVVVALGVSLVFTLFLASLALGVLLPVAVRAAVLEGRPGWNALQRAYGIAVSRPGRVLACWGLMLACQIGFGIGAALVTLAIGVPAAAAVVAAYTAGQVAVAVITGLVVAAVLGAVLIVAGAAFGAFYGTFWTLAYPRLEAA